MESRLHWAEISRCLGACFHAVWRLEQGLGKGNAQHMTALLKLAGRHGLGHLFTGRDPVCRDKAERAGGSRVDFVDLEEA